MSFSKVRGTRYRLMGMHTALFMVSPCFLFLLLEGRERTF